ncbi:MAG: TolC family protein [Phycisphaerae bacterium]|nr:TolC family protein [Phycisphaerae bacterium]
MYSQTRAVRKRVTSVLFLFLIMTLAAFGGCTERTTIVNDSASNGTSAEQSSGVDSVAILERVAVEQAITATTRTSTAPVGPVVGPVSISQDEIKRYTPDPTESDVTDIQRPHQVRLSLQDSISRALANNFRIKTEGYGPAISAMDILSAEAVFDAVYFLDANWEKTDRPGLGDATNVITSGYAASKGDQRTMTTGLRKAMPTGAILTGAYNLSRVNNSQLDLANIDPIYSDSFLVELRQPILRGFGIDVNRAGIDAAKNNQKISKYQYRRTVRDVLFDVEQAYWRLVQARRNVVIQKTLVDQTEETYKYLKQREDYDVYSVQITRVRALLGTRIAEYIQIKNSVKDAEDQLKTLLNDPELNLGEDIEIIPTDFPTLGPLVLDRVSEVQAALECRSELHEAKLRIENARINVAVTKNQALPRFDMIFRYTLNGLSDNAGNAFDQMSTSDFQDYFIGINFEYPIGNRGPRAEQKKAILQRDQAIAALKQVIENVILEVDVAVRNLQTAYYQVPPSTEAVQAAQKNVEAIIARMTKLSPEYLDVQLNAQSTMADARRALLNALVNYNIAIVQLERAKDTILNYDNVSIQAECK